MAKKKGTEKVEASPAPAKAKKDMKMRADGFKKDAKGRPALHRGYPRPDKSDKVKPARKNEENLGG